MALILVPHEAVKRDMLRWLLKVDGAQDETAIMIWNP
jgi:hypothetical protein